MKIGRQGLPAAAALLVAFTIVSAQAASRAAVDKQFSAAVSRILDSVKRQEEFLSGLSAAEYRDFVACAQSVMADALPARKAYVLAASNLADMRKRFDEVALDDRARLKQRITAECA